LTTAALTVNAARNVTAKWARTFHGSSADLEHKLVAAQISTENGIPGGTSEEIRKFACIALVPF
jgi:hypothetical protein